MSSNPCIGKVQRQIHRFMRSSYQKPAHLSINPTVLFGKVKNARERFAPHTGDQKRHDHRSCLFWWTSVRQTLDKAVTVKLTRTLAIIPITLVLSLLQAKKEGNAKGDFRLKNAFPMFILWFICASVITTICTSFGVPAAVFQPLKEPSKFFIILAMAAIG